MSNLGQSSIIQAIVGGADIAVAGSTTAMRYQIAKDTGSKIVGITQQTAQAQQEAKDKELLARGEELRKHSLIAQVEDMGWEKLMILGLITTIGVAGLGLGILYKVT